VIERLSKFLKLLRSLLKESSEKETIREVQVNNTIPVEIEKPVEVEVVKNVYIEIEKPIEKIVEKIVTVRDSCQGS
jgi:anaerobic ribonucleoside-triphosphate reductase